MGEAISSCTEAKDKGEIDVETMKEVQSQNSRGAPPTHEENDSSEGGL